MNRKRGVRMSVSDTDDTRRYRYDTYVFDEDVVS